VNARADRELVVLFPTLAQLAPAEQHWRRTVGYRTSPKGFACRMQMPVSPELLRRSRPRVVEVTANVVEVTANVVEVTANEVRGANGAMVADTHKVARAGGAAVLAAPLRERERVRSTWGRRPLARHGGRDVCSGSWPSSRTASTGRRRECAGARVDVAAPKMRRCVTLASKERPPHGSQPQRLTQCLTAAAP
jgi:hypothetical protein